MNASTCPTHAARWPSLWTPPGAPCPFDGCPNGTVATEWVATDGERYLKSHDYVPSHWMRVDTCIALDTRTEGS